MNKQYNIRRDKCMSRTKRIRRKKAWKALKFFIGVGVVYISLTVLMNAKAANDRKYEFYNSESSQVYSLKADEEEKLASAIKVEETHEFGQNDAIETSAVQEEQTIEAKIYNSLMDILGLTPEQTAGIMGNIQSESLFNPFQQEFSQEWGSGGWGLVQWTGSRRDNVVKHLREKLGKEIMDTYYNAEWSRYAKRGDIPEEIVDQMITAQVEYIKWELENSHYKKTVLEPILATNDVDLVSDIWLNKFETPAVVLNKSKTPKAYEEEQQKRYDNAKEAYEKYGVITVSNNQSNGRRGI